MSIAEIQVASAGLSDKERGNLAAWLLDSLPAHSGDDATNEGIGEAERRLREIERGESSFESEETFWKTVREERNRWK